MGDFFRNLISRSIPYLPMIILLICIYGFDSQKKEKKLRFSLLLFGAGIAAAIPVTVLDAFVVYIPTLGKVVKESKVRFRILSTSGEEQML